MHGEFRPHSLDTKLEDHKCLTLRFLGTDRFFKFTTFLAQSDLILSKDAYEVELAFFQTSKFCCQVRSINIGCVFEATLASTAEHLNDIASQWGPTIRLWSVPSQTDTI